MKKLFLILISLLFVYSSYDIHLKDSNIEYVSSILWTKLYDVKVNGKYAFCSFKNGLAVIDISDKKNPDIVSRLYLGGGNSLDIKNSYAFIAAGD